MREQEEAAHLLHWFLFNYFRKNLDKPVPICTCDLTDGVCELSCCCDPDCTSADINVFSSCLPGSEPVISQVCIEDSVIFTSNSPFPTVIHKDRSHSRFCVMVNDPKTNEFVAPQPLGRERFRSLVSQFGRGSFIIPSQQDIFDGRIKAASKDAYQFGDQIYTLFPEASVLGVFIQPTALVGGECTDRSPAVFLQSQSSTCFRRVGDVKAACDTLPALNAATYYGNFVLLPTLNFTSASKVKILPEGGQVVSSPRLMDNMCNNVVSEVTYRIQYKGGKGIDGAWVTFALTNVSLSATKIQQTFHVFFMTEPASSAAERRSGNPGYLKGKPILAFNGQAAVSLTVLKSDSDGSCSQSGRSSVLFRHNMKAGCSYRLAPRQTCSERQTHINLLLLGDTPPDSLGILGNASGSQTEGLTRIINPLPEAPSELCKSSCSLTLALEIQILWAYMGPLANPQAAVLGARFQYHRQDVPCSTGAVSLRTSVTFIETTRYPPAPRDHPTTDWKLPFDFFYPFKVSTSGVAVLAGSMLGSVCSVIVMGFLGQH
uniref:tectonic-3-like isoform X2 n=1 Tax=Pristiophorus japonicus TaxID=55135 RepID=UPI00398E6F3E